VSTTDEDESNPSPLIYGLFVEDHFIVESLITSVRKLLSRPNLSPYIISKLGVFLFGLERLPEVTEGISMGLSLRYELNRESDWMDIRIDYESFSLHTGFHTYDEGVGGDTSTTTVFEAFEGGSREGDSFAASEFAESFANLVSDPEREISISDDASDPFESWDLERDPTAWERLESEFL